MAAFKSELGLVLFYVPSKKRLVCFFVFFYANLFVSLFVRQHKTLKDNILDNKQ